MLIAPVLAFEPELTMLPSMLEFVMFMPFILLVLVMLPCIVEF